MPRVLPLALLAGAASALLGACILDLSGLTSGGTASSGGKGGQRSASSASSAHSSGASGTGGAGVGGAGGGCGVLDCTCASGPTVLASGATFAASPRGIAVADDGLYWVTMVGNGVVHLPVGGGPPQNLASTPSPEAVAVSGGTVVWTANDGLHACTASSCGATAQLVAAAIDANSLRDVAFDGQTAVWTDVGNGNHDGRVRSCAVGGCSTPLDLLTGIDAPDGITLAGGSAFWVDQGTGNQNGNVARSPETSVSVSQLAASLDLPTGVAADDTYVYWTELVPGGHVYRCPSSTYCDTPEDIAPAAGPLPSPHDIRIGNGRIYWTNADDGSIRSCPQPGCGSDMPTVHVTGRQGLYRMAVGTSCLFWTEDGNGGAVVKVAR